MKGHNGRDMRLEREGDLEELPEEKVQLWPFDLSNEHLEPVEAGDLLIHFSRKILHNELAYMLFL
jgi:hypothetical protein